MAAKRKVRSVFGYAARTPVAFGRWFVRESRLIAPAVLFFLVGFLLVLMVVKLFLAEYDIEFEVISKAAVGALMAGKVVLVLDKTRWGSFEGYPRAVAVASKTVLYGLIVLALGTLEKLIDAYRESGMLGEALRIAAERANQHRFLGTVLCLTLVFGAYFVTSEVNRAMGKGTLFALFFRRPGAARMARTLPPPEA
jgi:hypothetical protein